MISSNSLSKISLFAIVLLFCSLHVKADEPDIYIHYMGHSSFVLQFDNGISVLTDYGVSNSYGLSSPIYSIGDFVPDIMTFSHFHQDHYDPSKIPAGVQHILTETDSLTINGLKIKPVRTSESSISNLDNSSFIFTYKGCTIVHLADAQANIMNIANENNRNYIRGILPEKIDLLFMTIEGVSRFIPQAEAFIDFLQPKRVIPMHFWSREYRTEFLTHLETQNQTAGKNYQIENLPFAKYFISSSDTNITPVKVISLDPADFFETNGSLIWLKTFLVDDTQGDNNGRADASETVNLLLTLVNSGRTASNVTVTLRNNDPDIEFAKATSTFGDLKYNLDVTNNDNPFSFTVSSAAVVHKSKFYVDISSANAYTGVDSFEMVIGTPTILLIDDDGGMSHEINYQNMMIPEIWDVSAGGCPSLELLQSYESVIWMTGYDRNTSLTSEEQTVIAHYLDNGGRLLLSGENIGYDLVADGTESDSTFFTDYLHAQFIEDSSDCVALMGIPGDPISDKITMILSTAVSSSKNAAADIIEPTVDADLLFKYLPANTGAAIRCKHHSSGARLIYLGFGFERIRGPMPNTAETIMNNALAWLSGETDLKSYHGQSHFIANFSLKQNYPNPFNPRTTIAFSVPHQDMVTLSIFNLLGEEIMILVNENLNAGQYQVTLDATNLAGGVYVYRLKLGNHNHIKKCVLLK